MAVLLGLLSGIVYGAADFCGGLSTKRNPMVRVVLLSQLAGLVVYLVAVPLPAVALVSTARDPDGSLGSGRDGAVARMRSSGVPEAVAAGLAIAAFAILLDRTGGETGPWAPGLGRGVLGGGFPPA